MKTPEEILKKHAPGVILFGVAPGYSNSDVINAMEEYKNQFIDFDGPVAMIDHYARLARNWEDAHAHLEEKLRTQYDAEFEAFKMSFRNRSIKRLNILEEWLTEYRDQLKKENVYHKNTGIINAINELLDETSTNI